MQLRAWLRRPSYSRGLSKPQQTPPGNYSSVQGPKCKSYPGLLIPRPCSAHPSWHHCAGPRLPSGSKGQEEKTKLCLHRCNGNTEDLFIFLDFQFLLSLLDFQKRLVALWSLHSFHPQRPQAVPLHSFTPYHTLVPAAWPGVSVEGWLLRAELRRLLGSYPLTRFSI